MVCAWCSPGVPKYPNLCLLFACCLLSWSASSVSVGLSPWAFVPFRPRWPSLFGILSLLTCFSPLSVLSPCLVRPSLVLFFFLCFFLSMLRGFLSVCVTPAWCYPRFLSSPLLLSFPLPLPMVCSLSLVVVRFARASLLSPWFLDPPIVSCSYYS